MDKHRPMGHQYAKKDVLATKPKTSQLYKHISKTVDSGTTARDVEVKSDRFVAKQKNENFGRMPARYLFTLLCLEQNSESIYSLVNQDQMPDLGDFDDNQSTSSKLSSASSKTSIHSAAQTDGILKENSFLLVDVREESEFAEYRIQQALNYPVTHFKRDRVIPELFRFKNKSDKIIVIYSTDEKSTIAAGEIFFEKGYDNIYILTKGIEAFIHEYPQSVDGTIPQAVLKQIIPKEKKIATTRFAADSNPLVPRLGTTSTQSVMSKPSTASRTMRDRPTTTEKENKPTFKP